jgi:hypothetical protein
MGYRQLDLAALNREFLDGVPSVAECRDEGVDGGGRGFEGQHQVRDTGDSLADSPEAAAARAELRR